MYLSAAHPKRTEGQDIDAGITIDQVLASKIGQQSPLPSLEMCIEDVGSLGVCGVGYSCAYTNSIAWSSPTSPLPMERNPQVVFERLFGDGGTPEERAARKREDRSILDSVLADMGRLKRGLGASDLARFDDYLDDIREIERRIALAEQTAAVDVERPETAEMPFDEHVKLMLDLQVLAFKADITRVATMMFSRDLSAKVYAESGVPDAYHALSHHQDDPIRMERYAKLNAYHVSVVGYFLDKLRNTQEGGSNLLDNSLVMFGSPMGNSNMHDHNDLPIFIAGTAAGRYETQSAHREPEGHADRELLHDAGREGRHRAAELRRQHGPDGSLERAPAVAAIRSYSQTGEYVCTLRHVVRMRGALGDFATSSARLYTQDRYADANLY